MGRGSDEGLFPEFPEFESDLPGIFVGDARWLVTTPLPPRCIPSGARGCASVFTRLLGAECALDILEAGRTAGVTTPIPLAGA